MRLNRLHISGFKSFSDRAELAFDQGVTAIVGPNGCGKSNVADAIVWVLGEQSARSLRGERMEDVIFNGSDARKPQAIAEVTLRLTGVTSGGDTRARRAAEGEAGGAPGDEERPMLDLGVAREVELTRRLYRSGESEYLINGEQCRLRDIHDLLADTGLGAKAYAIIEQGKIGQILSSRPADRRQIIEEAAGITKYKARRRVAELKLEASQQNLTRVDDIIFEVEKQRGALKRQAAKARRYRRLRDELRRWEKVLFAQRYRSLAEEILASRGRLDGRRMEEAARAARLAALESGLGRVRIEMAEADAALTAAREVAHGRELEIDRAGTQIALHRQLHQSLGTRLSEIGVERELLESRREPGRVELETARQAASRLDMEREAAAGALSGAINAYATAQQEMASVESAVEQARGDLYDAMNAASALKHAIESAAAARDRVLDELSRLDAEHEDLGVELERSRAAHVSARETLRAAHESLEAIKAGRRAREVELSAARIEHGWRAREVRTREHDLAGLAARLKSLEELDAARAAYGDAARLVLSESGGRVAHFGSVADALEVDERYESAVEALLGDLLQHVVVLDYAQAASGLEFVRERDAGRCGFLVASAAGGDEPFSESPTGSDLVSLASILHVGGPAAPAIRRAIGTAWIAPSFDAAVEATAHLSGPVVTMAGEVIRGRHLVSGGGRAKARGILATKREIKALRDRLSFDQVALSRLAQEVTQLEVTIAQADAGLSELLADEHRQEKALVGFEAQLQRAADDSERLSQRLQLVETERRRAGDERASLDTRQQEAREAIERLDEDQREANERLARSQRNLAGVRELVEASSRTASEARATLAALVERAVAAATNVQRIEAASTELEARLAARLAEIEQIVSRRTALEEAVANGERQLDDLVQSLERLKGEVRAAEDRLGVLRGSAEQQEAAIRESRRAVEEVRAELGELEIALAKTESDLAHLAATCVETVQATLDDVAAEVDRLEAGGKLAPAPVAPVADEVEEEAGEEQPGAEPGAEAERPSMATPEGAITALKAKIDRLGPVNMMAIEQFDELEQRHGFLTVQRRDLVESISATGEAIRRIDETSKARFREAFEAINAYFQESFRTLFGGGQAGLALLDEQDVLESGIEIVAQPPGKRLQSVQLLSGGEKALAAISLMFAIFRYKPSPFCVLDEIDAPLDDANIGRFVDVLRGMQEDTQFILITHNRKTMEIADRLYGITMEEPGVSKLVSVKLN